MGVLYVVATPIGNLDDFSPRAKKILKEVDLILCEDTRRSLKLLNYFQIKKPLLSYHQYSKLKKIKEIIERLEHGQKLALLSDAGTPGISDPGNLLIREIREKLKEKVKIIPLPGPAAFLTLASVSGFFCDKFLFLGFLPKKKKRKKFLKRIEESKETIFFYESPYRLIKTLEELKDVLKNKRKIVVGKELTKVYEKIYFGTPEEIISEIEKDGIKGEYTLGVEGLKK